MLKEKLLELIKNAMKSKDSIRLKVLKEIKAAILEWETQPRKVKERNEKGEPISYEPLPAYDEQLETNILLKLEKSHKKAISDYQTILSKDNTNKLANDNLNDELAELEILQEFLPKAATDEELNEAIDNILRTLPETGMKAMGIVMKEMKTRFPSVDGGKLSGIVKAKLV